MGDAVFTGVLVVFCLVGFGVIGYVLTRPVPRSAYGLDSLQACEAFCAPQAVDHYAAGSHPTWSPPTCLCALPAKEPAP